MLLAVSHVCVRSGGAAYDRRLNKVWCKYTIGDPVGLQTCSPAVFLLPSSSYSCSVSRCSQTTGDDKAVDVDTKHTNSFCERG